MLILQLNKRAIKYLQKLPPKQERQVVHAVQSLLINQQPQDSKKLKYSDFHRVDVGEHRIAYLWTAEILFVSIIGKRNDGDIYKRLERFER